MGHKPQPTSSEREQSLCPCKSKATYAECCHRFHYGKAKPKTAEQLMRSRYSAFFFRLTEYLVQTVHPDTREPDLQKQLEDTLHYLNWQFLTIVATSKGGEKDKRGKVEFIADYFRDGEKYQIHEYSRFKRYKGAWKYLDDKG